MADRSSRPAPAPSPAELAQARHEAETATSPAAKRAAWARWQRLDAAAAQAE